MRGSRVRFAAFLAALAVAVSAFGGLVLPKLGGTSPEAGVIAGETAVLIVESEFGNGCDGDEPARDDGADAT